MSDFSTRFYTINQVHKGWPIFPLLHCSCFLLTNLAILHWHWSMHWSLPNWTIATRSLQVLLATCKTGCSLCWTPPLGLSALAGRRSTQPHCSVDLHRLRVPERIQFSGCVFRHIIAYTAQHRRIWQTACGRQQNVVARRRLRSADTTTLLVPPTRRVIFGDRAFPVAAARAWNSLRPQISAASSLSSFRRQTKAHLFRLSYDCWTSLLLP